MDSNLPFYEIRNTLYATVNDVSTILGILLFNIEKRGLQCFI